MKTLISFFCLFLLIGLPKAFGTELPLGLLILPFFYKEYTRFFRRHFVILRNYYLLFVVWFSFGVVYLIFFDSGINDVFFANVLFIKIALVLVTSIPIYEIIRKRPNSLLIWIVVQMTIVIASVMSPAFYSVMLSFISPRSAATFSNIYGLRSIGFGLFHIDGSLILITMAFYYAVINNWKLSSVILYFASFPLATTLARSAIIPLILFSFVKKRLVTLLFSVFVILLVISNSVSDGIFFEALEIFRVINDRLVGGDSTFRSTEGVARMITLPSEINTYLIGDGRFYDPTHIGRFYKETDIGYLRLLYYSGVFGLLIYLFSNLYVNYKIFILIIKGKAHKKGILTINFMLCILFLSMMVKGIASVILLTPLLYFYALDEVDR